MKALENVLMKFVMGMEFYDDQGRQKIAIGARRSAASHATDLPAPFFLPSIPALLLLLLLLCSC